MLSLTWSNEKRRLGDLKPFPDNPRTIGEQQGKRLVRSREKFAQPWPIVIGPDGELYDGHQRLDKWGDEWGLDLEVDVRVASRPLTEEERKELVVLAHEGATGEWDLPAFTDWGVEREELADWGFNVDELAGLLDEELPPAPEAEMSRAEELQERWQVQPGDLWEIGAHRLICGDCTDADVVARVMGRELASLAITDPPYGVEYRGGTRKREELKGDDSAALYLPSLKMIHKFSLPQAPLYLWHSDSKSLSVMAAVMAAEYILRCTIIWNKNQAQFGALSAQYKTKHEPCYYLHKKGKTPFWYGPTNEVSVWDVDRPSVSKLHPTQKPSELFERAIRNSSQHGDIVFDPFCGSGTTAVACERLGRKARMIEIHPPYCAVILERLSEMGLEARRL